MSTLKEDKKKKFLANFIDQIINKGQGGQLAAKDEALAALKNLDFPTRRDEHWKYTRVSKIINDTYTQAPSFNVESIDEFKMDGLKVNQFVFINGFFSEEFSNIIESDKVEIKPIAKAKKENKDLIERYYAKHADHNSQVFTALNTVYNTNGVFIHLKNNEVLKHPIHIIHVSDAENAAYNPRNLFIGGKSSKMQVIFSFETISGGAFTNVVTEIIAGENAMVDVYLYQNQSENSRQINTTQVYQERNSKFTINTLTLNGGFVRNNLNIDVDGEGCETNMYSLYLTKGQQHIDNHTVVDHKQPNCESNELYKGVLADQSTGVFNGKVFVNRIAQKTNAYQSNNNVLIGEDASINSKPELEIYADDVKCSHGSTTGQLDEDAIYYLRTRGIKENNARNIVVQAFAQDVIDKISIEELKTKVELELARRFELVE